MGGGELEGRGGGSEGEGDEDGETDRRVRIHHRRVLLPLALIGEIWRMGEEFVTVTEAGGRPFCHTWSV